MDANMTRRSQDNMAHACALPCFAQLKFQGHRRWWALGDRAASVADSDPPSNIAAVPRSPVGARAGARGDSLTCRD